MTPDQALIRLYLQAAKRLRLQIRAALANDALGTASYRAAQLQAVQAQLRAMGQRTRVLSILGITARYEAGMRLADIGLAGAEKMPIRADLAFSGSHERAAALIADNMASTLETARDVVGRRTEDVFRRAALEIVGQAVAEGGERRPAARALERELLRDGVTGFIDRRGARWQLDTYAEMTVRTTTREAMSTATANRLLEVGHDLVTISSHNTETELCKEFEGKTFSLTGRTPGYPVLPRRPPFHPRCLHVMGAGTGNLEGDLEALATALG